jgi:hypothetical protein
LSALFFLVIAVLPIWFFVILFKASLGWKAGFVKKQRDSYYNCTQVRGTKHL